MDIFSCHLITKYLAKIYFDFYLRSDQYKTVQITQRFAVVSMLLAIKFNQSFIYPPQVCLKNMELNQSVQNLNNCEIELLEILNYTLNYITPYNYVELIKRYFPQTKDIDLYSNIQVGIQLCALNIKLIGVQSYQILYGCLAAFGEDYFGQNISFLISQILRLSPTIPIIYKIAQQFKQQLELISTQECQQVQVQPKIQ